MVALIAASMAPAAAESFRADVAAAERWADGVAPVPEPEVPRRPNFTARAGRRAKQNTRRGRRGRR